MDRMPLRPSQPTAPSYSALPMPQPELLQQMATLAASNPSFLAFLLQQHQPQQQPQQQPPQQSQQQYPSSQSFPHPPPAPQASSNEEYATLLERVAALEQEIVQIQNERPDDLEKVAPARKKIRTGKGKGRSTRNYILKVEKGLTKEQKAVRKQLVRYVSREIEQIVSGSAGDEEEEADDESETRARPTQPRLAYNFEEDVTSATNMLVIDRAASLVYTEQSNSAAQTCTLVHKNVEFTLEDLEEFAKTRFRSLRRAWKEKTDATAKARKSSTDYDNRLTSRRRQLKDKRVGVVPIYRKKFPHRPDPSILLETDWMSDLRSHLDTSDEEDQARHREQLVAAARLGSGNQDAEI
ncbi:hypothetical protein MKEN_01498100 [Mycena kentingensis (nom. inval.)]|nr:hypothetical protein MKEN_01498100 [Mycena kentingensis (nom. inval.)]